ncbi:MAG: hypothetical protein A2020_12440 [Lentisphaerae bacterium GWF2_45_14]|nr:MAG: hypothetical protein A2020_12440 [Lentisphaerae bacterium GWF2_45_14]
MTLSSDILSRAALNEGFDVKKSEIHGMSQRGGSVFSHIRYGGKVFSPVIPDGEADILLSLEEMETLRWTSFASPDTQVICMNDQILPLGLETYPEGIGKALKKSFKKLSIIDAASFRKSLENPKIMNVALLGIVSNYLEISASAWKRAIESSVPKGTEKLNLRAFETGKKYPLE